MENEVFIITPQEYEAFQENTEELNKKNNEIKELENKIIDLEHIIKRNENLIKDLNQFNTENINQINKEHTEKLEKLTTLNTILISGLETVKETSFIDRLTNKNKFLANKIINDNKKQLPSKEFELKEKKRMNKTKT